MGPVIIYRKDRGFASFALLAAGNVAAQVIRDVGIPYSTIIPGLILTGVVPLGIGRGWRWAWWVLAVLQVVALIGDLTILDGTSILAIAPAIGLWLLMSGHPSPSQALADDD